MSKLTLDDAIKHCLEVAEQNETSAITYKNCKEIKTNMYEKLTAEKAENDCRECAAEHRQLAEWLTELKDLREENKVLTSECDRLIKEKGVLLKQHEQIGEYKRLLKAAVEDMYNSVNDVHCKYCSKWHTDQCQGTSHLDCYIENKFKWRYADESLKLIGEDEDENSC